MTSNESLRASEKGYPVQAKMVIPCARNENPNFMKSKDQRFKMRPLFVQSTQVIWTRNSKKAQKWRTD